MEIKIIGQHLDVTESINEYVHKKFNHLKFPDKLNTIQIRLNAENKSEHLAVIQYHHLNKDVHIEAKSSDLYSAIDLLADKTQRSFTKIKEKKQKFS